MIVWRPIFGLFVPQDKDLAADGVGISTERILLFGRPMLFDIISGNDAFAVPSTFITISPFGKSLAA